jgi:anti-sigma factor (TIGR02949 family)
MSDTTLPRVDQGSGEPLSDECRDALGHLAELLDHAMSEPDAEIVRAHIETCEPCLEAADVEEHVRLLVRRACSSRAPDDLRLRIVSQIAVRRSV